MNFDQSNLLIESLWGQGFRSWYDQWSRLRSRWGRSQRRPRMRRRGGAQHDAKIKTTPAGAEKTSPKLHTFQHAFLLTQKNKVVYSATLNKDETNFFHSLYLKVSRDIKWHVLYSQLYFTSGTSKTNETNIIYTDVTVARFSRFPDCSSEHRPFLRTI